MRKTIIKVKDQNGVTGEIEETTTLTKKAPPLTGHSESIDGLKEYRYKGKMANRVGRNEFYVPALDIALMVVGERGTENDS